MVVPLVVQTAYAELIERCSAAAFREAFPEEGTFVSKTVKGRRYWYFQKPAALGKQQKYAGPETPDLLERIAHHREAREDEAQRRSLVSALLQVQRTPRPSREVGAVVAAFAKAGVFRLRGVLVGTVAFQTYSAMLAVPLEGPAVGTEDVDIAQFANVSVAVEERIKPTIEILRDVDPTFRPIPHIVDGRRSTRYQAARGLRVDFLTPNKGADGGEPQRLPALRTDAEPLRFLDFLIRDPEPAVVLHDAGVYVFVPSPQRFAVHKLIVARRRSTGNPKRDKDLRQAGILLAVLAAKRPFELREAWAEAYARGRAWRQLLLEAVGLLPIEPQDLLLMTIGKPRSFIPSIDLQFPPSPVRYDGIRNSVFFDAAHKSGERVVCSISGEALGDHFGGPQIGPETSETFLQNRAAIERAAKAKYLSAAIETPGEVHLCTDDFPPTHR